MTVEFRILGPLQVVVDDTELALGRRQQRALLARLLLEPRRAVSVDRLLDDLWGDEPPASARSSLQALVSRLRTVLGVARSGAGAADQLLVHRAPGYALEVPVGTIDAERFTTLADEGRRLLRADRPQVALERLETALGLWRGQVLADLADAPFVVPAATRLAGQRADVREQLAAARLRTGAAAEAVPDLEALTADDGLRERAWELLLEALHATGRTAEALERYRLLRERFRDELGLDPGPGLQRVERALLQGAPLGAAPAPPPTPSGAPWHPSPDPLPSPDRLPSPDPPPVPDVLLGRDAEWRVVTAALAHGLDGQAGWVAVVGDAGIGKTTLVQALTDAAAARGARTPVGRCHEADVTPAFWPWMQVLRDLDDLVPGAGTLLDHAPGAAGDATRQRFELFDRVAACLRSAAARTPLLLVLEDVHWADQESLQLLDFLAVQLRDLPLTVLVTARGDEGPVELQRTLAGLARQPGSERLALGGIDPASTAALVAAVTGREVTVEVAERLHTRTGGNPLFTVELARLGEPALAGEVLPGTICEILTRRIDRLPPPASDLLRLAAVLGGEFGLDALVAASEHDEASVLDQLDLALAARLVVATDDPLRFRFAHALVRDAALDRLTDLQRRRTHLRIARSLRELPQGGAAAWTTDVARHLLAAAPLGDPHETLEAARAAAVVAERRLAYHEAASWWSGALRVLDWDRSRGGDQRLRFDLLCSLGSSLGDAGDWPAAIDRLAAAIDVAEDLEDPVAMADAATAFERTCGLWPWVAYGTRPVALLDRLDRVLAALAEGHPDRYIEVLAIRAVGEYYGDRATGVALADEALRLARALDRPRLVLTALLAKLRISYCHDDLPTQLACSAEMLALATDAHLPYEQLLAWTYRMAHLAMTGDLEGAEEAFARARDLSHRLGLVIVQAQLGWSAAMFPLVRGDLDEAERLVEEANAFHARTGLYARAEAYAWARAVLLWERDRPHDLEEVARPYVPEVGYLLQHRSGDHAAARARLGRRCATVEDAGYDHVGFLQIRARVAVAMGAGELAATLIEQLAPHADRLGVCGTVTCVGPVATELAQLHDLLGDHAAASALLERTLRRAEAAGWRTWAGRARRVRASLPGPPTVPDPVGRPTLSALG
jgi:DNA-binding SARP family transcriptional activator